MNSAAIDRKKVPCLSCTVPPSYFSQVEIAWIADTAVLVLSLLLQLFAACSGCARLEFSNFT